MLAIHFIQMTLKFDLDISKNFGCIGFVIEKFIISPHNYQFVGDLDHRTQLLSVSCIHFFVDLMIFEVLGIMRYLLEQLQIG